MQRGAAIQLVGEDRGAPILLRKREYRNGRKTREAEGQFNEVESIFYYTFPIYETKRQQSHGEEKGRDFVLAA